MKFKIQRYEILNLPEFNWRDLRNNSNYNAYFLPYLKIDYIKKVDIIEPSLITKSIISINNTSKKLFLFSIGSGLAALEYQIKKFSNLSVIVSDNNDSIMRLKNYNIFDDALMLDALNDPIPVTSEFCVLMSRIDTEFNDNELIKLFEKCHNEKVLYIYFIPAELLSIKKLLLQLRVHLLSMLFSRKKIFCGYARNKNKFINLWSDYYELSNEISLGSELFVLKRKA